MVASGLPADVVVGRAAWFLIGDPAVGLLATALVAWGRRRHPVAVPVTVTLLAALSASASGAVTWALCSVATRRRWRELALLVPLNLAAGIAVEYLYPDRGGPIPWFVIALVALLFVGITVAVGLAIGSERARVDSLRERAETAEREQHARVDAARAGERTRIAREMHDVLAHRITLVAMHAGALSYRTDLSDEERATAAATIERNAHLALTDLRAVLGVLRDEPTTADSGEPVARGPEAPQPGAADIPRLVDQARASGLRVSLDHATDGEPGSTAGRTAYRIVQEGLTNAHKHAPGTAVTVTLDGRPADGLTVLVTNPAPVGGSGSLPPSGLGLLGLAERVSLAGGTLTHGHDPAGGYTLRAWLPWAS
jgi:signal transduction histidine kinase